METTWDCIVVGAGAAGLSAALVLGRARQRTLVIDAGGQSNRDAHGIGGLLGNDGRPPAEFYAAGRDELAAYPTVRLRSGEVLGGARRGAGFVLELADGSREVARRVLLATGMDYRFPALPGIVERWGRSVFHCPFCHGWEVRDQPLGVLDRGATGVRTSAPAARLERRRDAARRRARRARLAGRRAAARGGSHDRRARTSPGCAARTAR